MPSQSTERKKSWHTQTRLVCDRCCALVNFFLNSHCDNWSRSTLPLATVNSFIYFFLYFALSRLSIRIFSFVSSLRFTTNTPVKISTRICVKFSVVPVAKTRKLPSSSTNPTYWIPVSSNAWTLFSPTAKFPDSSRVTNTRLLWHNAKKARNARDWCSTLTKNYTNGSLDK